MKKPFRIRLTIALLLLFLIIIGILSNYARKHINKEYKTHFGESGFANVFYQSQGQSKISLI